jgi:hypothetical protein
MNTPTLPRRRARVLLPYPYNDREFIRQVAVRGGVTEQGAREALTKAASLGLLDSTAPPAQAARYEERGVKS